MPPAPVEPEWEGGFDAVIGNPPYVRQESLSDFKVLSSRRLRSFDGVADLFAYFMEKGVKLLRPRRAVQLSCFAAAFSVRPTASRCAERLKRQPPCLRIVDFGGLPVFANAKDTYVCIPAARQRAEAVLPGGSLQSELADNPSWPPCQPRTISPSPTTGFRPEAWSLKSDAEAAVFAKVMQAGKPLGDYVERKFSLACKPAPMMFSFWSSWPKAHARSPEIQDSSKRSDLGENTALSVGQWHGRARLLHPQTTDVFYSISLRM